MGGLTPNVVDVFLALQNQTPPKHAGPIGRITSMVNAQIKHFLPSSTTQPQHIQVEAREAFQSVPTELRSATTGENVSGSWANPEILATLGEQLLSICGSVPRVFTDNDTWTHYGDNRVVTNVLSENVLHTTNHLLQAPDSAQIGNVKCFVWTQVSGAEENLTETFVGFRSDDKAWIRVPTSLYASDTAEFRTMAKVVQDGTYFWVFFVNESEGTYLTVNVYDTHGVQLATLNLNINWTDSTPGYWDVTAPTPFIFNDDTWTVLLAQPGDQPADPTVDVKVELTCLRYDADTAAIFGATELLDGGDSGITAHCNGPVAWLTNDVNDLAYLATLAPDGFSTKKINAYEIASMAATHEYSYGIGGDPDACLTGWVEDEDADVVCIAFSRLSDSSPVNGPANDPGLRVTRSYSCTRGGAVNPLNQATGVLLQSRALRVDDDWYAVTYYQSGGGITSTPETIDLTLTDGDYFIGDTHQPLTVTSTDLIGGSPINVQATAGSIATANPAIRLFVVPSQGISSITHNAGDSAVAATQTWTFLNASFSNVASLGGLSAFNSYLNITGSSHSANNHSFRVISVLSATQVVTEAVSTANTVMVDDTLAGVTASLGSTTTVAVSTELIGSLFPPSKAAYYTGSVVVTGAIHNANNTTFTCIRALAHTVFPNWIGVPIDTTMLICTPVGTNVFEITPAGAMSLFQFVQNAWLFGGSTIAEVDEGNNLIVSGALNPANDGSWPITDHISNVAYTAGQTILVPEAVAAPLPTMSIDLTDPSNAYHLHIAGAAFDSSYLLAYVTISNAVNAINNGLYQISQVLSGTDVVVVPSTGITGQRNESFEETTPAQTATIFRTANTVPATQPCWFLTPLSMSQQTAGRFEYGIAYADWRFDGNDPEAFGRNIYPWGLTSVTSTDDGLALVLPYRAQSFTAGQVVGGNQTPLGVAQVSESTVGLKEFRVSETHGQAISNSGEMFLPGPQASQFTASGFHEDGINLGFEKPWLVSQEDDAAAAIALTIGASYQYVLVAEETDENGDRIYSVVSPPLDVTLQSTNNTITIGGRTIGPTNRNVTFAIYRTSISGGSPTVQHYKITNDLDPNGENFTFSYITGSERPDTWTFKDQVPDPAILSSEVVYADKGQLQHFPAPAFRHGVASWQNRSWVVGYDGAIWMSAEKTEGDAIWFHPGFRFFLPTDDKPVALALAGENYLIFFCTNSVWYLPAARLPDATDKNGSLPTPQPLPFPNGCTGHALTMNAGTPGAGAVYSSTAGGIWMIDRSLRNIYLSQPMQDDLQLGVSGLTIDGQQRLVVATDSTSVFVYDQLPQAWYKWVVPTVAQLITTKGGQAVYQDENYVSVYTPDSYTDLVPTPTGIAPDVTLALTEFGNVRGLKSVWACDIVGEYKGYHRLHAVMSYPDDDEPDTTFGPFVPDADEPYIFEINPMVEQTSSYGLRVYVDFTGALGLPGNSMTLELFSFEVGIEPTLSKVRDAQRIPGR